MKVGEICEILALNQTTVSHQLAFLRASKVVKDERIGKNVVYAIRNKGILSLFSSALDFIDEEQVTPEDLAVDF